MGIIKNEVLTLMKTADLWFGYRSVQLINYPETHE